MFARSICGMIMCVLWTLYFYVFILSTELLFTGSVFAFISVIPKSFERKNTPVDDG
jgi:bacteriorhodopsin